MLLSRSEEDADLFVQTVYLMQEPVTIAGYASMIDLQQTIEFLQRQARHSAAAEHPAAAFLRGAGKALKDGDEQAVVKALLQGQLIVLLSPPEACFALTPVPKTLSRSVEAPTTENVLRGSISAFIEDIDTNIGMVKKQAASDSLRMKSYWLGTELHKRIVLFTMEGYADPKFVDAVAKRIEQHCGENVQDLQQLSKMLGFSRWVLVTKFNSTELPQEAAFALRRGKAVILMDRLPFALILPSQIWDMFIVESDRNFPIPFMYLMRSLRILGVLGNILMPGLYVALVSVNPDVLRIELALSIAESRAGVPYPSFMETILFLIVLELILEASVRLPKSIGPTITMVGGIILGQAVVAAKLVSNLLIIVLAATTIANSTVVGFQNSMSIRFFKYLILVLSAMYGVLGMLSGLLIVCAYLSSQTSFGIPYLDNAKSKGGSHG